MTAHLLALSVGPVQDFIAAARRTRDLWFGSYLLSEISKAAAKAVQSRGGALIFPAPADPADLNPGSPLSVANIIVAELGDADPKSVADAAKEATWSCWRGFADEVFHTCQAAISERIWDDQVDDVIEFYAAWYPFARPSYQADRAALMRLLAARKRCRDFKPAKGRAGVPKSSLDGLRESVLHRPGEDPATSHRRLRLNEGEQLDVVGVVKRAWAPESGPPRYPSVARVAADSWLRRISLEELEPLKKACRALGSEVISQIDGSHETGHPQYAGFPFDGTAVFRTRFREICEESGRSDSDLQPLRQALETLTRRHGEPNPYLAVLVADGDRMGQALSAFRSPDDHRAFSRALAGFAAQARAIVDDSCGVLVYAGGDDLLAFVPLDRCLACARRLHDAFGALLASWSGTTELTLSVGLAIAHFMEPLEDLLRYARAAEHQAKRPRPEEHEQQDRNGLAVHVVKRGGGPLKIRANWPDDPDLRIQRLAGWIQDQSVPGRVAYDMHRIAKVYDSWSGAEPKDAIERDLLSVMRGKQARGESRMEEIKRLIRARVSTAGSLRSMANDLLVARVIAAASADAAGGADLP